MRSKSRNRDTNIDGMTPVWEKKNPELGRSPSRNNENGLHSRKGDFLESRNHKGDRRTAPGNLVIPRIRESVNTRSMRCIAKRVEAWDLSVREVGKQVDCCRPMSGEMLKGIGVASPVIRIVKARSIVSYLNPVIRPLEMDRDDIKQK